MLTEQSLSSITDIRDQCRHLSSFYLHEERDDADVGEHEAVLISRHSELLHGDHWKEQIEVSNLIFCRQGPCGQYYKRVTIVATIVIQISYIILIARIFSIFERNDLAYLDYDRNAVIVLATDLEHQDPLVEQ